MSKATDAQIAEQARKVVELKRKHERCHTLMVESYTAQREAEEALDWMLQEGTTDD